MPRRNRGVLATHGSYVLVLSATNGAGESSTAPPLTIIVDNTPPQTTMPPRFITHEPSPYEQASLCCLWAEFTPFEDGKPVVVRRSADDAQDGRRRRRVVSSVWAA